MEANLDALLIFVEHLSRMSSRNGLSIEDLRQAIRTCPIIDNHAHNLLLPDKQDAYSLLTATTEAQGQALEDTPRSLSHLRALRQLRELYGCSRDAEWEDLMGKRRELLAQDADAFIRKCLVGTHAILMDDGLDDETVHSYKWHDRFTSAPTKRIVRIEAVAADIMKEFRETGQLPVGEALDDEDECGAAWLIFLNAFERTIADKLKDVHTVAFKSVCCYRTGLDVKIQSEMDVASAGQDAFMDYLADVAQTNSFRISHKGLNDCLVISTCRLLAEGYHQTGVAKPLQFHTGLGDNDISLLRSNPACLQPLIAAFPTVTFILLHSSYPYTREAGYLATVYKNAYLDLGEVFPMVGRDGQLSILREAMELTPMSKLLWSTDGHHFAETYYLANKQWRQVLEKVMVEYVEEEDITVQQAIQATQDIMFNNSNRVYFLKLQFPSNEVLKNVRSVHVLDRLQSWRTVLGHPQSLATFT